jgi:hypothetical protein
MVSMDGALNALRSQLRVYFSRVTQWLDFSLNSCSDANVPNGELSSLYPSRLLKPSRQADPSFDTVFFERALKSNRHC